MLTVLFESAMASAFALRRRNVNRPSSAIDNTMTAKLAKLPDVPSTPERVRTPIVISSENRDPLFVANHRFRSVRSSHAVSVGKLAVICTVIEPLAGMKIVSGILIFAPVGPQ